jgi:hypothetical protein
MHSQTSDRLDKIKLLLDSLIECLLVDQNVYFCSLAPEHHTTKPIKRSAEGWICASNLASRKAVGRRTSAQFVYHVIRITSAREVVG